MHACCIAVGTARNAGAEGAVVASTAIVQLRALALRNLAGLLLPDGVPTSSAPDQPVLQAHTMQEAPAAAAEQLNAAHVLEALALYGEAVKQRGESEDGVLWGKLADTAGHAGQLGLARYALEAGMAAAPHHQPLLERAMEVRQHPLSYCVPASSQRVSRFRGVVHVLTVMPALCSRRHVIEGPTMLGSCTH